MPAFPSLDCLSHHVTNFLHHVCVGVCVVEIVVVVVVPVVVVVYTLTFLAKCAASEALTCGIHIAVCAPRTAPCNKRSQGEVAVVSLASRKSAHHNSYDDLAKRSDLTTLQPTSHTHRRV